MESSNWNNVSSDYQKVFELGLSDYGKAFMQFVTQPEMLPHGGSVLDVGCGVGKYGTCFAGLGYSVALTDISENMIAFAEKNMAKYTTPWKTLCCDFDTASPDAPFFRGGFDLVISTMSPAIHSFETTQKMSILSHGWCVVAKFISWEQPLRDKLMDCIGYPDREKLADSGSDILQWVRMAGYEPKTTVVPYSWSDERTPEEMVNYIERRSFSGSMPEETRRVLLRFCKKHVSSAGTLSDIIDTQVVWVYWNTHR